MTARGLLPEEEIEAAQLYRTGKYTQEELAHLFTVAPVTIRRGLAEHGLVELKAYKTRNQTQMLEALSKQGFNTQSDIDDLLAEIRHLNRILDKHGIEDLHGLDWALSGSQP